MKTSARSAVILSTAVLLGWSAAALAAPTRPSDDVAKKTVKFADLDISTADGAQALYERIASAARAVCRGAELSAADECRASAIAAAVAGVGSPLLSAAHRSAIERVEELVRR